MRLVLPILDSLYRGNVHVDVPKKAARPILLRPRDYVEPEERVAPISRMLLNSDSLHRDLSPEAIDAIVDELVRYLVLQQKFRECMNNCTEIVGRDRLLKQRVRKRVERMLDHPFYTMKYRPALLRISAGDYRVVQSFDSTPT